MLQLQLATYAAVVVMWQAPSVASNGRKRKSEREWERRAGKTTAEEGNVCCQEKCALKLQPRKVRKSRGRRGRWVGGQVAEGDEVCAVA